ncbi:MAG: type II secretion system protein [Pseudomonadota bacterium]|jgi:prepilin-type N-terminal cleavage/methylation domain-containing protein
MRSRNIYRQRGFSLIEIGVALIVVGLLTTAVVAYLRSAGQERVALAERDLLADVQRTLVGWVHARHRLPCPDADGDGQEDCAGAAQAGSLPWRTLGLPDAAAGRLRYGVYRRPDAVNSWQDLDLAQAHDRLRPLVTQGTPPAGLEMLIGNANLLDFCYALDAAGRAGDPAGALAVQDGATRRPMAFVVAAPGLLDADGDGDPFDGRQHTAGAADPTFDAANRARSDTYDDKVLAMDFGALFARLHCGQALSAIGHSHFNAATGAAFLKQAAADYQYQLGLKALMAGAGVAAATAKMLGAGAGLAGAVATSANAIAFTILTYGTASAVLVPAAAAIIANTAAIAVATGILAQAIAVKVEADNRVAQFASRVSATQTLASSVDTGARLADALGY